MLEDAEIDYTVFMHTWRAKNNIVRMVAEDVPNVEAEYVFLNPSVIVIDEQDEYLSGPNFNFSMYWYESEWKRAGEYGEWWPQLVHNHVCALESLRRLTRLVRESANSYDLVMYVRPDV